MHARFHSHRAGSRGSAIVEASMGLGLLMVLALLMLKSSLTMTSAQQWTIISSMTDAYMTRETAIAKRAPLEFLTSQSSPWPIYPAVSISNVEIGKLPGGQSYTTEIRRTREPGENNLAEAGGSGTESTNPASMEAWKFQSYLVYSIGGRSYVKNRTTLRVR